MDHSRDSQTARHQREIKLFARIGPRHQPSRRPIGDLLKLQRLRRGVDCFRERYGILAGRNRALSGSYGGFQRVRGERPWGNPLQDRKRRPYALGPERRKPSVRIYRRFQLCDRPAAPAGRIPALELNLDTEQVAQIREIRILILGCTPNRMVSVSGAPPNNIFLYRRPAVANSPGHDPERYAQAIFAGVDGQHPEYVGEHL